MSSNDRLTAHIERFQRGGLIVGLVAGALALAGLILEPDQFFHSYLVGFIFILGLPMGSFGLLMLHHMTGGNWGFGMRRFLEAAVSTSWLLALLFVPLALFGMPHLFPWLNSQLVASSEVLTHKEPYLNHVFFLLRAVFYFLVWIFLAWRLNKWSYAQDESGDPSLTRHLQAVSGPGLIALALTVTFASVDWVMSLEPTWFSTIYGLLFLVGFTLLTLGLIAVLLSSLSGYEPLSDYIGEQHFHDVGNLMLAFLMLWAYMSFSQFLIIWAGNIPEEISWYLNRTRGGWQFIALALVIFHFALPFLLLLSRFRKRAGQRLRRLALALIFMRLIDVIWWIEPALNPQKLHISWLDFMLPLAMGGFWLMLFSKQLKQHPLLPLKDPRLIETLERREAMEHA